MSDNTDNVHFIYEPQRNVIRSHLERLFRRVRTLYPGGWCEIIWTDDRGKPTACEWFPITEDGLDKATTRAVERNKDNRNLYVGVNPRKPDCPPFGRANAGDVDFALFQFVDADSIEAAGAVLRAPLPYTWVVLTGRIPNPRPHAYWELEEPIRNMDAWRNQQRAMANYFGSDAVIDPPRIMRLAGTVNYPTAKKLADGYRIELVTLRTLYDDQERDPVTSEALYHTYPWKAQSSYQGNSSSRQTYDRETGEFDEEPSGRPDFESSLPPDPLVWVNAIKAGKEMHNNARDLIAHLISTGHRDWLIRDYLEQLLRPVSDGGTLGEIDKLIQSARTRYDTPDPPPEDVEDFDAAPPRLPGLPLEWFDAVQPNLDAADFVEGLLTDQGLSVLYGESNCGKTFFMTDLAFHVACGRRWRDRAVEQGGVIYVALEGGFGIRNRLAALRMHYQPVGTVPFGIVPHSVNLLDPSADTGRLIELIEGAAVFIGMPIKLIVIDTLARALNGGNENAPEDMGSVIYAADRIREATKAHVVFVHHSGKDQARGARGHSSLRAATDTEIEIVRPDGAERSVSMVKKQRELEIEGAFAFTLKQIHLGINRRGKSVTSCVVADAEAPDETPKGARLTPEQYKLWVLIEELFNRNEVIEVGPPEPGMPNLRWVTRENLRHWLARRGWLHVTPGVTPIGDAERKRMSKKLNQLRDKGYLDMNEARVWLLKR